MTKREILTQLSFGQPVAEEEERALHSYFVETDQWRQIVSGEIDVIFGAKGSGKSAIYTLLASQGPQLAERNILLIQAENPRGTPAFKDVPDIQALSEADFRSLWKLYFLTLIVTVLRKANPDLAQELEHDVVGPLEAAGLIPRDISLRGLVRSAIDYIRGLVKRPAELSGGLELDPASGLMKGVSYKIRFEEPSLAERELGMVSIDTLVGKVEEALGRFGAQIWILLDRLDVAFADSQELEASALRGLLRTYLDFRPYYQITLKVFLRSDIWRAITRSGFREASHIIRKLDLEWNRQSLLDLVVRRILYNPSIRQAYRLPEEAPETAKQEEIFYQLFPEKVDKGRNPKTFDWMLSRTRDGSGHSTPRELIQLLIEARREQLRGLETGSAEPRNGTLFDSAALRAALRKVSETRLNQTLFQEYPDLADPILQLSGRKADQTLSTLVSVWQVDRERAEVLAKRLVEIGFFAPPAPGPRDGQVYSIPFLYQPALSIVRGKEQLVPEH